MKYRSRTEIIRQILESCSEPKTKTRIMYDSYLSFTQLTEYMKFLVENKLLELNGNLLYIISAKGKEVLDLQERIRILIGDK